MGKFLIKEAKTGFTFALLATNGQTIAVSEVYASKDACLAGIQSVRTNAPIASFEDQTQEGFSAQPHPKFEMYIDKAGEHRFRLKAKNGQIIAVSEGYSSRANCLAGIESVRKNALDAETVEV